MSKYRDQGTPAANVAPIGRYAFLDDATALHLSQAFATETDLESLLGALARQLKSLAGVRGLHYVNAERALDMTLGDRERHKASYNLEFHDTHLGELTLYFKSPKHERDIQTCEDVLSLAFTSLRNCVLLLDRTSRNHIEDPSADALVLVALDGYEAIRTTHGEEWAHILMTSVHQQIEDGLRHADGIFHIGNDLIAVLLPNATTAQAAEVAKKVRVLVASLHLRSHADDGDVSQQLTVSIGISSAAHAASAEAVMEHARTALAQAQARGLNQTAIFRAADTAASSSP